MNSFVWENIEFKQIKNKKLSQKKFGLVFLFDLTKAKMISTLIVRFDGM